MKPANANKSDRKSGGSPPKAFRLIGVASHLLELPEAQNPVQALQADRPAAS
jgi:hypothetical protein